MKKAIIIGIVAVSSSYSLLAYGCGSENCDNKPVQAEQSATGSPLEPDHQPPSKGWTKEMAITDFVIGERTPEKGCGSDANCREETKLHQSSQEPHTTEQQSPGWH